MSKKIIRLTEGQLRRIIQEAAGGDVAKKLEDDIKGNEEFVKYLDNQIDRSWNEYTRLSIEVKKLKNLPEKAWKNWKDEDKDSHIASVERRRERVLKLHKILKQVREMSNFIFNKENFGDPATDIYYFYVPETREFQKRQRQASDEDLKAKGAQTPER